MSLVQYSSSDEESDVETTNTNVTQITSHQLNTPNDFAPNSISSISSFLPPPKSSLVHKSKGVNLVSGTRKVQNEISSSSPDKITLPPADLVPDTGKSKLAQTAGNQTIDAKLRGISLFSEIKNKPKSVVDNTKITIQSFQKPAQSNDEKIDLETNDSQESPNIKKRKAQEEILTNIKEFDVSEFYKQNIALKDQGLLQENKSLHTVTHHRNQLSALMKNAKQDEELLKARHEHNKRAKKDRQDQYGW